MKRHRVKEESEKMKCPSDDDELDRGSLLLPIDPREWGRRMLRLRVLVRERVYVG